MPCTWKNQESATDPESMHEVRGEELLHEDLCVKFRVCDCSLEFKYICAFFLEYLKKPIGASIGRYNIV